MLCRLVRNIFNVEIQNGQKENSNVACHCDTIVLAIEKTVVLNMPFPWQLKPRTNTQDNMETLIPHLSDLWPDPHYTDDSKSLFNKT